VTTDNTLADTLDTYARTWGPVDHDTRLAALRACLSEEFIYTDPNVRTVGYEELAAYMDGFQHELPGGGFVNRRIEHHHDALLVHWDMVDPTGQTIGAGASSGRVGPDGRLQAMTGFFDQPL
jgi:SnoaL-like domain